MKGQLQALEPIIITIVLGIIMVIGVVFYINISGSQSQQDKQEQAQQDELVLLARTSRLPELSCSEDVSGTNCIDLYKANALAKRLSDPKERAYYFTLFGASNITIEYVDLVNNKAVFVPLYSAAGGNRTRATRTYFTVYDPVERTTNFATLIIEREIR
jgi:hypothetical protein